MSSRTPRTLTAIRIILLIAIAGMGGYLIRGISSSPLGTYLKQTKNTPTASPTPERGAPTEGMYKDSVLGIHFSYPPVWGPIQEQNELGFYSSYKDTPMDAEGEIKFDGPVNRSLRFVGQKNDPLFLFAHRAGETMGRGGFFGDVAAEFSSATSAEAWCKKQSSCEFFTNAAGIKIAHAYTPSRTEFDNTIKDIDEYGIFHESHPFFGIIISNQGLEQAGLGRNEKELRALVESLEFDK